MVFIVQGMHKSGTTLVSEMLHHSGIHMTSFHNPDIDYDSKLGKMECPKAVEINNIILSSKDKISLDIQPVPASYELPEKLIHQIKALVTEKNKEFTHWGIKDPRMCLTYHLWEPFLPEHKLIIIYRNPYQVVKHYQQFFNFPKNIINSFKTLRAYRAHNVRILEVTKKESHPSLIMDYNDLMENPQSIQEISDFTGINITDKRNMNKYRKTLNYKFSTHLIDLVTRSGALKVYNELSNYNIHEKSSGI